MWAVLALVAFVMSLGSAIWVLLPHSLVFAFRGEALLGISDQEGVEDVGQAYRAAGIWIEPYLDYNRDKIAQLPAWFTASCVRSGTKEIEQASPERVGELVGHAVKPVET